MAEKQEIGLDEVRHMAQLSRLTLTPAEEARFAEQFAAILGYMDILNDVDVTGVAPLYSPSEHPFVPRPDVVGRGRTHEEVLQNAPKTDSSYFIVPRIV